MYGSRDYMTQSRFLKEAQSVLSPVQKKEESARDFSSSRDNSRYLKDDDLGYSSSVSSGYSSNYAKSFLQGNKPKVNTNASISGYKSGVKVKHTKFGEGVVIATKGTGDNIIVDVAFKGVGIKSLSAKFAPMEII
jgi:hypothetical protein